MQSFGIYTLANDPVLDQLIALLNSIEVNVGAQIPVCIIPYDDRLTQVRQEIAERPHVSLFNNSAAIHRWETFAQEVWAAHPQGSRKSSASLVKVRKHAQRRYAAFDGEFEKFVVYDADCLAMKPLDKVFAKLDHHDFVFDDWEHAKPESAAALMFPPIEQAMQLTAAEIQTQIHCSSFFGSKRGLFDSHKLSELKQKLVEQQEVNWINGIAEAFLFSYLTLRGEYSLFNFTLSPDSQDRTGNCADADRFVEKDQILYNADGLKPIHRIHYMNYGAEKFARLAQGENVGMRYQEMFLLYRFLKNPHQTPILSSPSFWTQVYRASRTLTNKISRKISRP
ncbi:MAG: hypothetical protein KME11_04155 [Timaviella obliquedivisa GSE-PSE-MK23-08B]|jgi:hypothetical protein|nr:hypothetical protein [Timaviella obliquedivisa GSE-PSE-MK23-08B]